MTIRTMNTRTSHLNRSDEYSFLDIIRHISATHRQRKSLQRLDDAALEDIGLTQSQVASEVKRSIWDVPNNWRR